jgi:DNA-binding FrmR family transcriptional regulator
MLTDAKIRSRLASGQHEYIRRLRRLHGSTEVLTRLLERDRSLH